MPAPRGPACRRIIARYGYTLNKIQQLAYPDNRVVILIDLLPSAFCAIILAFPMLLLRWVISSGISRLCVLARLLPSFLYSSARLLLAW